MTSDTEPDTDPEPALGVFAHMRSDCLRRFGFRYMLLNYTGIVPWEPDNSTLTMRFINTAAKPIASIHFSDPTLNQIQAATVASAASNWMVKSMDHHHVHFTIHHHFHHGDAFSILFAVRLAKRTVSPLQSIPTDCPQRAERLGWMGDA